MRMSKLFGQTLRELPSEAEVISHSLMLRAGYISRLASGIFSYLPLAFRSMSKIENIIRQEMDAIGGQEVRMPVVHPADIWKETQRWYQIGQEMGRFKDRGGRDMVLAMTHEEVVADLVRKEIRSYRQLPALIYQFQTKWRDDPRPRAGLVRVREFTMKDSYSLDASWEGMDTQYRAHYQAYFNIFNRCGLPVVAVGSDVGMMGGAMAHEFMYLTAIGEDTLVLCDNCGYAANRQIAGVRKGQVPSEEPKPVRRVATPGTTTIEELSSFLQVPKYKTAKAVFMVTTKTSGRTASATGLVLALVRGDMDVNETKLANAIQASELRPAYPDEIRASGAVPGYASPIGLRDVTIVVDEIIPSSPNLIVGGNAEGYHLENVNLGRDFNADIVCDLALAKDGDACLTCGNPVKTSRGVEVGNIFKLGTRYSEAMGCTFLDKSGKSEPVIMGSYGIGIGRLLACIAEEYHDEAGLMWPISVAPYQVHLVSLSTGDDEVVREATRLYDELHQDGIEVLYDDRSETAGVKFADADLIGIPLRVTVSKRTLANNSIELKHRNRKDSASLPRDQALGQVQLEISHLENQISSRVMKVQFKE